MTMIQRQNIKRRVLVVDDQEINRELLGMILEDDYRIEYAENGREAMDILIKEGELISAVLLDLIMPIMNGYEVIAEMKKNPALSRIPIIVLTAEATAELETLRMGAASFITKPFEEYEVVKARVSRIVELSEDRKLINATERDESTGLYNAVFFFEYAEQLMHYRPEWQMDAIVLAIDRLRLLGELHGKEFISELLSTLGQTIKGALQLTGGIGGHVSADRFYVFTRRRDSYEEILAEIQKKADSLNEHASVGLRLGICDMDNLDLPVRFECAASALDDPGTSNVKLYDHKNYERQKFHEGLVHDLPRAIRNRELVVYYQPKYDISGDEPVLCAAEALIRWKHPQHGMVSPGEFIPLFEENGLISQVDSYVWQETARQLREWRDRYGLQIPISVNLSRVNAHEKDLESKLLQIVGDNGLEPKDLHLEVTESACTNDAESFLEIIERLRSLGFAIEMDDFGAGYSSLNVLYSMPIDILKMDMLFVRNLESRDDRNYRLIEIVGDIARYLEVPLIAEGVETERQVELLKDAGADIIQGYFFSPPVPAEKFESFFA